VVKDCYPKYISNSTINQVWQLVPVIPATQQAEAGFKASLDNQKNKTKQNKTKTPNSRK
jgi:hypothetical protein